jgi:acyl carrier protein
VLYKIIAETIGIDQDSITDASDIVKDLGADSLNIVEIIMACENEYDMDMPDEDVEDIFTVGQLQQYIKENS